MYMTAATFCLFTPIDFFFHCPALQVVLANVLKDKKANYSQMVLLESHKKALVTLCMLNTLVSDYVEMFGKFVNIEEMSSDGMTSADLIWD